LKARLIDAAAPLIVAQRQSALAKPEVRDNDPRIPAPIFSSRLTPSSHPDRRATVCLSIANLAARADFVDGDRVFVSEKITRKSPTRNR
jgi:hypothetical protein